MTINVIPKFLSVAEVAESLGLCERTVKRRIESGELAAHKFGQKWKIKEADLQDYIARSRYQL